MDKNPPALIDNIFSGDKDTLLRLLVSAYTNERDEKKPTLNNNQIFSILLDIEERNHEKILTLINEKEENLSNDAYAYLQFTNQLNHAYQKNSVLDKKFLSCIPVNKLTAKSLLEEKKLPWGKFKELDACLQLITNHAIGWQSEYGRASERFLNHLKPIFDSFIEDHADFSSIYSQLETFFDKESERIKKLESRLFDSEKGALQAKNAKRTSAKILNQQMAGKKLPRIIANFLQGPWYESLRLLLISDGEKSDRFRRMIALTETLIWSFQPIPSDDSERKKLVYDSISEVSEELYSVTTSLHHDHIMSDRLSDIEHELLKVLRNDNINYEPFNLIENTDPLCNSYTKVSSSLISKVDSLLEGQWFIYKEDNQEKRIKLALKISDIQQLLFTNFIGNKAAQFSFEQFAYLMSSSTIMPLSTKDIFRNTGEKLLKTLHEREQEKQKTIAEKIEQDEIERLRLEEEHFLAKEKALTEAKALAARKKAASEKLQQAAKDAEQLRRQKIQQEPDQASSESDVEKGIEALNVGGWVEFYDDLGNTSTYKLAVKLQSTGKFIFVDRGGIKREELLEIQLAAKLLDGSAKILDKGNQFEDSLAKVVHGLRNNRKI